MANRSYLYSAETLPTETENPTRVNCVSEHRWDIPLAHKLLVGREPRVVQSMIWDPKIGIGADYAGGTALLLDLLRVVGEGVDEPEFASRVAEIAAHLEKQSAAFFILETGEMISLDGGDVEEAVEQLVATDIPRAVARAEAAIAGEDDEWLESVRASWRDHFDSHYSNVLYFSFPTE
ncbi:hypothetical protein GCM10009839_18760 [Catenulispora yoronensis]|uniref:DUF7822 domain-containing protein n=1 Tax=Catenulispora yoronensis TaxID=450799 RepID=A0ABP5FA04_9ACTN